MFIELPQPRSWDDFEDLVCDVLREQMMDANLQRFGRAGQRQCGVDILGYENGHAVGIQCKHYRGGTPLSIDTIKKEFKKTARLGIPLKRYVVVTTAKRDARLLRDVAALNARKLYRTTFRVMFWEDIERRLWLTEGMLHRHYAKQFPIDAPRDETHSFIGKALRKTVTIALHPGMMANRPTARERGVFVTSDPGADPTRPAGTAELNVLIAAGLDAITRAAERPSPYAVALAVSDFVGTDFADVADLSMNFSHLSGAEIDQVARQRKVGESFRHLALILDGSRYSRSLIVYAKARLTTSFMLGWALRRVAGFDLKMVVDDKLWGGEHLREVPSLLTHDLPIHVDESGNVAVVLNVSREITDQVRDHYATGDGRRTHAGLILPMTLSGFRIASGAHANAIARDVATHLKAISDATSVRRIHLFGAMPTALAALIATRLNATKPIDVYFREVDRENFGLGAVLTATE